MYYTKYVAADYLLCSSLTRRILENKYLTYTQIAIDIFQDFSKHGKVSVYLSFCYDQDLVNFFMNTSEDLHLFSVTLQVHTYIFSCLPLREIDKHPVAARV